MYVVIVYDVGVERVNKVRSFLREYLNWVQNSVFEGELTKAEFLKIKSRLKELIEESHDHIIFYSSRDKKYLGIENLGTPKADTSNII
ncbi:CRISPR-associated protein Cas2 [Methanosarcina sp. 2.H.T.1A.6]|uniref:CRISPR-associated endonuclease Cas2 n=1 Tax=unclassified Methanosarcina TaxID=2644672 RepID=UPI000621D478|nr:MULTISPECIES: CRISPR-associated endonuclease Cas2 [unclassified Methanosarcina]KKG13760.1 CRISPR-associated protein Cas2 [Methanosarcina sp. 2.H.T.1A.3]KKG18950.1 CRISPR-associated protein Cas2 [Methanosarcina sp. 2.H.T.1A.15]KKG21476.1 CRISPR-associated protein Cas2 [Methanosarcina sp. 2.H.T.1A.8]KKG21968.1 CRISPR-associated protein Cas2 [Methanosarcina sp. 2.H.T.1A.6]